jgi:DEAD/DEAH box helicase domain-containing protein
MVDLKERLGHRLGLESIAEATFGLTKTGEGMQTLEWFRQGKLVEIAEYCCFDVKLTKLVHEFGLQHRQLFYRNRFGATLSVGVDWVR